MPSRLSLPFIAILCFTALAGCPIEPDGFRPDATADAPPDLSTSNDSAPEARDAVEGGQQSCAPIDPRDFALSCVTVTDGRCSDVGSAPQCQAGQWTCPAGQVLRGLCQCPDPTPGGRICPAGDPCAPCKADETCVQLNDSSTQCRSTTPTIVCRKVSVDCRAFLPAAGRTCSRATLRCEAEFCPAPYQCMNAAACGNEVAHARVHCYAP
jgi:hypothetical protein